MHPEDLATKSALRKQALSLRTGLSLTEDKALVLRDNILALLAQKAPAIIAGYWPSRDEISPLPAMLAAEARGWQLCLPVTEGNRDERIMHFYGWHEGDVLTTGNFGIAEPANKETPLLPDVLLLPLLSFDGQGGRLGFGGGYYDATITYLKSQGKDVCAIGVAYDQQICLSGLPIEAHDQFLDAVCTQSTIHLFSAKFK